MQTQWEISPRFFFSIDTPALRKVLSDKVFPCLNMKIRQVDVFTTEFKLNENLNQHKLEGLMNDNLFLFIENILIGIYGSYEIMVLEHLLDEGIAKESIPYIVSIEMSTVAPKPDPIYAKNSSINHLKKLYQYTHTQTLLMHTCIKYVFIMIEKLID